MESWTHNLQTDLDEGELTGCFIMYVCVSEIEVSLTAT
jgi:hypothetical protein